MPSLRPVLPLLAFTLAFGATAFAAPVCTSPGSAIPDNATSGVTSSIVMPSTPTSILDLDVSLDITHPWTGDLEVVLSKDGSTANSSLIDRLGVPPLVFGCSGDNVDTVLDDEGAAPVESQCSSTPPAVGTGPFQPNTPLSAFDGINQGGTWNLKVVDHLASFTGTLNSWCLIPTYATPSIELKVTAAECVPTVGDPVDPECPDVCGSEQNLVLVSNQGTGIVPGGHQVRFCYTVTNTGDVTLNSHSLSDSGFGQLLNGTAFSLAPGATTFITKKVVLADDASHTATWSSQNAVGLDEASSSASGSVRFDDDGDGTSNAGDSCPLDPLKIQPGVCGCGTEDTDLDQNGILDCLPDVDNDGVPDVFDQCPADQGKVQPGLCGCGIEDDDSDRNGYLDCLPDADGDRIPDLADDCVSDSSKGEPGTCGCGNVDQDLDKNGIIDCRFGAELGVRASSLEASIKKLRTLPSGATKKQISASKVLKAKVVGGIEALGSYISLQGANIVVKGGTSDLTKLSGNVTAASRKALNTQAAKFTANRKKALKAILDLKNAIQ